MIQFFDFEQTILLFISTAKIVKIMFHLQSNFNNNNLFHKKWSLKNRNYIKFIYLFRKKSKFW